MIASQSQVIESEKLLLPSNAKDGCLLLSLGGSKLFSLNENALVVWSALERHPEPCAVEDLVACLTAHFSGCSVTQEELVGDVSSCVNQLANLGLLQTHNEDIPKYQIKADVFRTSANTVIAVDRSEVVDSELSYCPMQLLEQGYFAALIDTWVAFLALVAFEVVLKFRGFGVLFEIVERWPVARRNMIPSVRARQICAAVDRARVWYPKKVFCFQHSAVISCLLRRQGFPAVMVVGGRRIPFYAHAWVEVGSTVVNDDQAVRHRYTSFKRCVGFLNLLRNGPTQLELG